MNYILVIFLMTILTFIFIYLYSCLKKVYLIYQNRYYKKDSITSNIKVQIIKKDNNSKIQIEKKPIAEENNTVERKDKSENKRFFWDDVEKYFKK